MYKVEIRNKHGKSKRLIKVKYYQTKDNFLKWLKEHTNRYEKSYTVNGFYLKDNEWTVYNER